ncbi:MAG: leucine-rich repeat protein [Tannerellaceae bacterium]|jgi:uncharacterized protein YjdB|nr:leucine-rich repeat protein [Tannerellaceae bacterium]
MKKVFLLALVGLSFLTVREIKAEQYNLSAPGTLSQKVDAAGIAVLTELKIVGEMNAQDFSHLRKAKELIVLDLQSATFTGGVLPEMACYGMHKLKTVTLPLVAEEIGDSAFVGTNIAGLLSLPLGLKRIGAGAFAGCSGLAGTLDIPASVETLEDAINYKGAFYGCSGLETLVISSGSKMVRIGAGSFHGCSGLKSVRFPKSITAIGGGAFAGCTELSGVMELANVKYIEGYNPAVPESRGAFEGCEKLEGVRIDPNVLARIGSRAFKNCSALTGAVYLHASVIAESIEVFEGSQIDMHSLQSTFIRPDSKTEGLPWCTIYSDFARAVGIRNGYDNRYFFLEGTHKVSETQYIESDYIALSGGYNGKERWGESPQGGESRLSLSADSGDVLTFDYNWDIPLQIDIQNIAVDGIAVVKTVEGNWEGAKVSNASFYSPVSLAGNVTFRGKFTYDAFSSSGKVTMNNVTLAPIKGGGYNQEIGESGLLFSELAVADSLIVDYPLFTNGERTILTTKGDNRLPINFFHHTISGRALSSTEQVTFKWEQENGVNKLQMVTSAPLTISLTKNDVPPILAFGESLQFGATFSDENDQRATSWASSRPDIVEVGQSTGYITAKNVPSDATVTVTAPGERVLASACRVYVAQIRFKAVNPRIISPLESVRLRTDVLPDNLPDRRLIWSVSDTEIATIDSTSGVLKAGGHIGHVVVTARLRANDKVYATHDIYIAPSSATLQPLFPASEPLQKGKRYGFKLLVEPNIKDEIVVKYKVSDPAVVILEGDSIHAIGQGTAVITAGIPQSPRDTLFTSLTVTVISPVTGIEVAPSQVAGLGDVFDIPATVFPNDADESEISWVSKDPTIVAVQEEGGFEALKLGTVQLIASTANGFTDTCEVKVGASAIRLNVKAINLQEGTTYPLSVSFVPVLANDEITWSTSDPSVAIVDTKGLVTAVGVGEAKITASTGARTDTCTVTGIISSLSSSFYLLEQYKEMNKGEVFTLTLINTTGERATWVSDQPSIVSVTDGIVTAHDIGSAIINAISSDGSSRTAVCAVWVRNRLSTVEAPTVDGQVYFHAGTLFVKGFAGHPVFVVSLAGLTQATFIPTSEEETYPLDLPKGVYLLHSTKGKQSSIHKFVVR